MQAGCPRSHPQIALLFRLVDREKRRPAVAPDAHENLRALDFLAQLHRFLRIFHRLVVQIENDVALAQALLARGAFRIDARDQRTFDPGGHLELSSAVALLGGPALYLAGNVFFKRASAKYYPLSHLVGLGLLVAIAPFEMLFTPLALGAATTAVLITVAIWETRSFASDAKPAVAEHSA